MPKTFTDRDIVRIYLQHLDAGEQQRVRDWFAQLTSGNEDVTLLCGTAYPVIVGMGITLESVFGDAEVINDLHDGLQEYWDFLLWIETEMEGIERDYLWIVPPRDPDAGEGWFNFRTPVDDFWFWWDGLKWALKFARESMSELLGFLNVVGGHLQALELAERAMRSRCNPDFPVELNAFSVTQGAAYFRATQQLLHEGDTP